MVSGTIRSVQRYANCSVYVVSITYQREILEAVQQKVSEGLFAKGISRSMMQKILHEHKAAVAQERGRTESERRSREERGDEREEQRGGEEQRREEEQRRQPQLPEAQGR